MMMTFEQGPYLWAEYDTSIADVLSERTSSLPFLFQAREVWMRPANLNTLLKRHHAARWVFDQDIYAYPDDPTLFVMLSILVTQDHHWFPIGLTDPVIPLETKQPIINGLRASHRPLQRLLRQLAHRNDVTPYRLTRDHGILSALLLCYLLYRLQVNLEYHIQIYPDEAACRLASDLPSTLSFIKGVLFNGETQWFGSAV